MESLLKSFSVVREVTMAGVLDMALVALVIYAGMVALKRTRRSGFALTGIFTLGVVYILARKFGLQLTVALLQGFFAVFLVALVVIFQEDLRYFFERVGLWWMERRRPLRRRRVHRLRRREVETLARTLTDLARARVGALVVIRGRDLIARHVEGGVEVQGRLSEALLKSIFDPHSIGHDGAVVIEGNVVDRLGCHLPLSKELDQLPGRGTRHAAALGLAERTDAMCLVVSEEHGDISVAFGGELRRVEDAADLVDKLETFYDRTGPAQSSKVWFDLLRRNSREKALAVGLSVTLWAFFVQRSQLDERAIEVKVGYTLLPNDLQVISTEPPVAHVRFRAARRDFEFLEESDVRLELQLLDAISGTTLRYITARDLTYPSTLVPVGIEPREVVFEIQPRTA
ncbi:MAG: diadenylate cyclase, partial [Limisphaerales bacterium]